MEVIRLNFYYEKVSCVNVLVYVPHKMQNIKFNLHSLVNH